eukprot:TRINITY_DN42769_c0_g1_i1.p1 TRINITY_DN42769_c0_g1~~TRINITY_DN42769_c0_g1_i1.p1  ORF type:complete len:413 (+),score=57.62 TRINITY_DN42769_c0_g1_i1:57-1241(+)
MSTPWLVRIGKQPQEYEVTSYGFVVLEAVSSGFGNTMSVREAVPEAYRFQYATDAELPHDLQPGVLPADFSSSIIVEEGRASFHTRKGSAGPEFQADYSADDDDTKNFHTHWNEDVDAMWMEFFGQMETRQILSEDTLGVLDADPLWLFGIADSRTQRALDQSRERKVDVSTTQISLEAWLRELDMEAEECFTVFEWNPNAAEIWDQFIAVVQPMVPRFETIAGEVEFTEGPFKAFGLTRSEVQEAKLKNEPQAEPSEIDAMSESERNRIAALPEREQVRELTISRVERILGMRRQQEGHLISVPGHHMLILSLGRKYSGTSSQERYRVFGVYDVPVGFISTTKVDGMPAIFMTRQGKIFQGTSTPEFQIIFLPKHCPRPNFVEKPTSTCCMLQ